MQMHMFPRGKESGGTPNPPSMGGAADRAVECVRPRARGSRKRARRKGSQMDHSAVPCLLHWRFTGIEPLTTDERQPAPCEIRQGRLAWSYWRSSGPIFVFS